MKFNRLYTKIFLSFLAVLVIAEALVLVLFVAVPARRFSARMEDFLKNKALAVRGVVETKIGSSPDVEWSKNLALKEFVTDLSTVLGARVWLSHKDGVVAVKSFPDELPAAPGELEKQKMKDYGGFKLLSRRGSDHYAIIPIVISGKEEGSMHVLINRRSFPPPRGYLVWSILILGLVVAVAIIPVTRLITGRLKRLRESTVRIAEGELSHRAAVEGKDEIGELAWAFNDMTDKLERMIVSVGEVTAHVSHELRSPLTRIRIAEEMAREKLLKADPEDGIKHLDAIREDIGELDSRIGRILELSKLNTLEATLRFEPLDPAELIRDLLKKLGPAIDLKGLQVDADLRYEPPFAGDREALSSALMNILDNAVKFAPEKGSISLGMDWQPAALAIRIRNTFERLSDEDLLRIFDPFHRVGGSSATGAGLGLTIARKAIERHGGSVEAGNAEAGLEIAIVLPRGH